jgi:hypothetical protein
MHTVPTTRMLPTKLVKVKGKGHPTTGPEGPRGAVAV